MAFGKQSHPHGDLTGKIIGAAQLVHDELKPGLDEKIYENALCIEFAEQQIPFCQQKQFPVHYKGQYVGKLIPDLIADERVIVDTKVVETFSSAHIAQMLGYLNITGLEVGLLINFKNASLEVKRVANIQDNQS